jgi:branched-chain amino acid transport system substrate-binding protein
MPNRLPRALVAALFFSFTTAHADYSDGLIKIGVLTDLSGPYASDTGTGSVLAAQMAVADFAAAQKNIKVEVISADHKNKADLGTEIATRWYDAEKVDVIVDVPNSAVALAVNEVARQKKKALLVSSAATSDLTGKACSPNTIHWTFDTWALANGTGSVTVLTGGKTWTFLTMDNPFGQALQRDTAAAIVEAGGSVVASIAHPFSAPDLTSYLKQAQSSGAQIIGLANAGADSTNAIKLGAALGIGKGPQQFAGLLVSENTVHQLGLETAQGLILTSAFYWNLNPKTRAWSRRFYDVQKQMPNMAQAGVYSAVLHYLKAAEALRADDGTRVIAKMKSTQTDDPLFGFGTIRPDGRKVHNMYLFQVKKPSESRGAWDYFKLRGLIPPDTAFRPRKGGGCALVR